MTAVLVGEFTPGSPEWLKARTRGIGASEIAAVVGLSPWESPFSMWHRKKGNIKDDANPDNPLFYWGHALEPLVADKFAERHPEYDVKNIGTHHHADRPWQIANLDRQLVGAPGFGPTLLEIKTTRYADGWGSPTEEEIPMHVRCQVMQQMDVFGYDHAWVAVLIAGSDYREYPIEYYAPDAQMLREAGAAFWQSVQDDDEPPIDTSKMTYETVRELHPHIDGSSVEISPDLAARFHNLKADAEDAEKAARQAKAELLNEMKLARFATVNGIPVARRQPNKYGVSLVAIKENAQ